MFRGPSGVRREKKEIRGKCGFRVEKRYLKEVGVEIAKLSQRVLIAMLAECLKFRLYLL